MKIIHRSINLNIYPYPRPRNAQRGVDNAKRYKVVTGDVSHCVDLPQIGHGSDMGFELTWYVCRWRYA